MKRQAVNSPALHPLPACFSGPPWPQLPPPASLPCLSPSATLLCKRPFLPAPWFPHLLLRCSTLPQARPPLSVLTRPWALPLPPPRPPRPWHWVSSPPARPLRSGTTEAAAAWRHQHCSVQHQAVSQDVRQACCRRTHDIPPHLGSTAQHLTHCAPHSVCGLAAVREVAAGMHLFSVSTRIIQAATVSRPVPPTLLLPCATHLALALAGGALPCGILAGTPSRVGGRHTSGS